MGWVGAFFGAFGLMIVYLVIQARKAGPRELSDMDLRRGVVVRRATPDDPGTSWDKLGSRTTAEGLRLRFDHDDDPQAEASFLVGDSERRSSTTLANRKTVRLAEEFETHHVHTRGYVFQVRLRGAGPVVGKEVRIQMHVDGNGEPFCGRIENDDDTDAAVGGWIEFEFVEVLEVGRH